MSLRSRRFIFAAALVAALVMSFLLSGAAFASGDTTDEVTICVDGYVINHREEAVNGTKTTPPLEIDAIGTGGAFSAAVGADGYFKLEKLLAGDWAFGMQLPVDWEGIAPEAERGGVAETPETSLAERKGCYRILFKVRRVIDVTAIKFEELLDGTVDYGEGWVITATPVNDPFVKAVKKTTDENGEAQFLLTPGRWIIAETLKSGWKPLTPKEVTLDLDQYGLAEEQESVVFKNLQPACKSTIVVHKYGFWEDEGGMPVELGPLAGWKVTITRADGMMAPVTKVTDGAGIATFAGLLPGVYKVHELVQPGWTSLTDNPQTVIHKDCETTHVRIDNQETRGKLTIHGTKFFKAWVPPYKGQLVGLPGWEITAKLVGTDKEYTVVTDALGQYVFTPEELEQAGIGFPGATIDVCEEVRDHWISVTPKCVRVTFPYPVPATYTGAKVDFTNVQDPPVAQTGTTGGTCTAAITVVRGQTLARIAAQYGTSVLALARANGIRNPDWILEGQKLCVQWGN